MARIALGKSTYVSLELKFRNLSARGRAIVRLLYLARI
jgi:hypothetical protein